MTTLIVSRYSWFKCFSLEYSLPERRGGDEVKEAVLEKYGIDHWEKINQDEYKITFVDDKKMSYWLLRWS